MPENASTHVRAVMTDPISTAWNSSPGHIKSDMSNITMKKPYVMASAPFAKIRGQRCRIGGECSVLGGEFKQVHAREGQI